MVNEDANAKLIRELKEEILKLRELLKAEGIEVQEGLYFHFISIEKKNDFSFRLSIWRYYSYQKKNS